MTLLDVTKVMGHLVVKWGLAPRPTDQLDAIMSLLPWPEHLLSPPVATLWYDKILNYQ